MGCSTDPTLYRVVPVAPDDVPVLLRRADVQRSTGLSEAQLYAAQISGDFPRPTHRISERIAGWTRADVLAWIESRRIVPAAEA